MESPADLFQKWPFESKASVQLPATLPGGKPWPKISIITPSYNQGHYIEQTILSVANQNYPNVEHIIMDGGSKDQTVEVIKKHESKLAYWVSEKDGGQSNAINTGMNRTTGEIVTWLNSDDMLAPGALAAIAMAFHTSDADLVAGICQLHRDNKVFHNHLTSCANGVLPLEDLLDLENCVDRGQFFYQPEVFYKKDLWLKAGGKVDSSLNWVMDYDLWIRFAIAGARLKVIGRPVAMFRVHEDQKTNDPKSFRGEAVRTQNKYREAHGIVARPVVPEENVKKNLTVLLFNDIGFNYGAGIAHKRLAQALHLGGNKVTAFAAGTPGSTLPETMPVAELVLTAVKERSPDVVVLGNLHGLSLPPQIISDIASQVPTVFVTHDLWVMTGRCVHMRECEKYLTGCDAECPTSQEYPRMAPDKIANAWRAKMDALTGTNRLLVMANSQYVAGKLDKLFDHLAKTSGTEPKGFGKVHLGISTEVFRPVAKAEARKKLRLPQDKFIIMYSAADLANERKGSRLLFAALDQLNLPDLALVCVGWRDKAQPLPRKDIIEAGYVTDQATQVLYYAAADLFVGPSMEESFGQVYVEAAACGTPSVGFRVTAIPETIIDGVTGTLADELTPASLAGAIELLYRDKGLRESMGVWGRILVENDFSIPAYYHRLFVMLRQLLNKDGTFLSPNISLALEHGELAEPVFLQDGLLENRAFSSLNPLEREEAKYLLYRKQLDEFRNGKFPWVLLPAAWKARRRRDRAKARFEKLKKQG